MITRNVDTRNHRWHHTGHGTDKEKEPGHMIYRHRFGLPCYIFMSLMLLASCNGQASTRQPEQMHVSEVVADGQPKLVRTRGSDRYSSIYCAVEDKTGNLWFGTMKEGVYRYDGKHFTQFTTKDGLGSDTVLSIMDTTTDI